MVDIRLIVVAPRHVQALHWLEDHPHVIRTRTRIVTPHTISLFGPQSYMVLERTIPFVVVGEFSEKVLQVAEEMKAEGYTEVEIG